MPNYHYMPLSDDELDELETLYQASTKGVWRRARTDHLNTISETRDYLGRMVDFYSEQPRLALIAVATDGSDNPGDGNDWVCPALTGNGPAAEANAAFLEVAHNDMPHLLAEIREARRLLALRPALR